MAKKIVIVDDLTGEAGAETHWFTVDGSQIEIDLCPATFERMMTALAPYIDAGRRVANGKRTTAPRPPAPRPRPTQPAEPVPAQRVEMQPAMPSSELRAWWKKHIDTIEGLPPYVAFGRVPEPVRKAWHAWSVAAKK